MPHRTRTLAVALAAVFTMLVLGYQGMPRRYYDHLEKYHAGHVIASIGAYILAAGVFIFFANLLVALFKGKPAETNPWGGLTLEWRLPSPPPTENFETIPAVHDGPYAYNPETKE